MSPDVDTMLTKHDAALLIGDPALQVKATKYFTYDLAEEWIRATGKPFVFAFWAVRKAALEDWSSEVDLAHFFRQSRDHGLEESSLAELEREWSARLGIRKDQVRSYLTNNIHYYLDSPCLQGLTLFYQKAANLHALPQAPALEFLDSARMLTK
jgi:chorismate dehydratase